jgi:hypothetical protein
MNKITTANIKINSKAEAKKVASQLREVRSLKFMRVDADKQIWGTQEEGAWIKSNALLILLDGKPKWYHLPVEVKNGEKDTSEQASPSKWTEDQEDGIAPVMRLDNIESKEQKLTREHGKELADFVMLCKRAVFVYGDAEEENDPDRRAKKFCQILGL